MKLTGAALLIALAPLAGRAEAPFSAPPPAPRAVIAAPTSTLLPSDLAAAPAGKPAAPAPQAPAVAPAEKHLDKPAASTPQAPTLKPPAPKPRSPGAKPAPPETAETLDWATQVRDALNSERSIAPPTPLNPNPPPDMSDASRPAPAAAPRPRKRPSRLTWSGAAAEVCKDPRLAGEAVAPITDPGACGISKPVRVTHVGGVALSTPIYVNCRAAVALADWLGGAAASAPDLIGAKVTSITPFASYACRNRNSRAGGKLSEHAKGNAVDVGRFGLSDGRSVTVKEGWRDPKTSGFLKRAWRTACNSFGTVLGPGADIHHQDHFHLDVAKHRGGAYCR